MFLFLFLVLFLFVVSIFVLYVDTNVKLVSEERMSSFFSKHMNNVVCNGNGTSSVYSMSNWTLFIVCMKQYCLKSHIIYVTCDIII